MQTKKDPSKKTPLNRIFWQRTALVVALASPFGTYASIQNNNPLLAAVCFAFFAASMALTFIAG